MTLATCKECESPILARGLCGTHYSREYRKGLKPLPDSQSSKLRKLARAEGKKYFFTGVPCLNGHVAERRVDNGGCTICGRDRAKKFVANNPDKIKYIKIKYYDRRRHVMDVWAAHLIGCIRNRSKKQNIPFNLTIADVISVIPKDRLCPALGIPLIWGGRSGKMARNSPSIDRIVPSLGYVAGNIAIISHKANSMKQDVIDSNELRSLANWMDAPLAYIKS